MKQFLWMMTLFFLIGCGATGSQTAVSTPIPPPFSLRNGFTAEALSFQFRAPTQFFVVDNSLWVAQLNGGESNSEGQVVRVDLDSGEQTVVVDQLDKPTGIALLDNTLWIATRDQILRLPIDRLDDLQLVLSDLPNNGRSNGTLTVTPNGRILYTTSGSKSKPESGRLWELDPATGLSREMARGLKNGYAHVYDQNGRLWITEIADGTLQDVTLPDEINLVQEGANFGWPTCYGRELVGTDCNGVRPAVAVLPEHSTPTGIAVSPFAENSLFVALWLTGEVFELPIRLDGDNAVGEKRPFIENMQNPQHLFVHPDGTLWVSEFATGKIWIISPQSK